ncbi:probable WRKY transcription factor 51 [Salvia splendens]|uniref:probable WRKY transcription factor 51 n=1 Tax=Salvia splendens TaxID=180675 RepID=UPI001C268C4B|nr:probable WRKY transcription factor 51 [Salvia splendens]
MSFNFNFDSILNVNPQFQKPPNPNPNPNFDREIFHYQADDALYFKDVSDYLMSEERSLSPNNSVLDNVANSVHDESSSSMGNKRIVRKYNTEKQDYRVAFRTKSKLEIMDDGFKWRKYGKKRVKSSPNLRNYFKCSNGECSVKKRVERDGNDSSYVITTYEGVHNHESPTCVLYCNPQSLSL